MGEACGTYKKYRVLVGRPEENRQFGRSTDGTIMLKRILKKWDGNA
jgi:hypothetical protein